MVRTALRFMRYDRPKSIGIIVGIVISIFLIGQQLGTLAFIARVMGGLINNSNPHSGEIWVIDKSTYNVNILARIDSRLVREIRSIKGVKNTFPIVVTNATVTFKNARSAPVKLVGSRAPFFAGGPDISKILKGKLSDLAQMNTVSVEHFNIKEFNAPIDVGTAIEINGKNAIIKVETMNAQGFGGHYMYTNIENARFYASYPHDKVSIVAVKIDPQVAIDTVISRINHTFYGIKAWKTEDLKNSTATHLLSTTNMGLGFGTLVVFAIITGFFIIGLTLYSSVLDRLKDYGTYKAIGANNGYVRRLILTQALIYAIIGFALAILLLFAFKQGVANVGLIVLLTPQLIGFLFLVTLFISIGGSLFAIRKINKLEPASVFK